MPYRITYSDDRVASAETYAGAVALIRDEYPDAICAHDGDLRDGGNRTLCWANEADAVDDDGVRAIAVIAGDTPVNENDVLDRLRRAAEGAEEIVWAEPERELEALRNLLATETDPEVRARIEQRITDVENGARL